MFTVMIAEDELLVRIGIAGCVQWDAMNMRLVGEVADGLKAWEVYSRYHPDIVITDIRMPGLTGMELLRRIRENDKTCAVIIVTNVENGQMTEEARALGITEILLKATMNRDDINKAVRKALQTLPQPENDTDRPDETGKWDIFFEKHDTAAPFEVKTVIAMHVFPGEKLSHRLKHSLVDLFIHRFDSPDDYSVLGRTNSTFLLFRTTQDTKKVTRLLTELARFIQDNFGIDTAFGLIPQVTETNRLWDTVPRLESILREKSYFDMPVLLLDGEGNFVHERLDAMKKDMNRYAPLGNGDPEYRRMKTLLNAFPGDLSLGAPIALEKGHALLHCLKVAENYNGLQRMAERICEAVAPYTDSHMRSLRPEIRKALDYIEEHLTEELTANEVCAAVGFHPAYFSRLFKTETGYNYSDYLNRARILKAEELLRSTVLSIQEIADRCGFTDVSYFGVRFKKETGASPKQWREEMT